MVKEKQNPSQLLVVLLPSQVLMKSGYLGEFHCVVQLQKLACADPSCFVSFHAKMPTILLAPHCEINMDQKFFGCL